MKDQEVSTKMILWNLIEKVRAKSSVIAVFTLCIGIVLLSWSVFSGHVFDRKWITLTSASAVYLLLWKRFPNLEITPLRKLLKNDAVPVILNILYVIVVCFTVVTVLTSNVYIMPVGYFVSIVAACLFVALDILFMPEKETKYTNIILAKIIIVSLLLMWAPHYKFPNIGTDPWYHMAFVNDILKGSHIPLAGHEFYRDFAAMHFIVAIMKTVTSFDIMTSMMSIGFFEVLSLLSLYCIGKTIINKRVGLFAAFFLATSNQWIFWSYYTIPMALGLGFIPIELYIIIKFLKTRKRRFSILSLLFPVVLIYVQPIATFMLLIILVAMNLGDFLHSFMLKRSVHADLRFSMPIYVGMTAVSYYMYVSGFLFDEIVSLLKYVLYPQVFEAPIFSTEYDITTVFLENLGFILFMGLAIVGILYHLDHRQDDKYGLKLVSSCLGISIILYVGHFFGKAEFLLPERWWVFIYVVAAVPVAEATILIYNAFRGKLLRLFGVSLIVLFLSFSMISTSFPTLTTALVDEKNIERGYFYDSELVAAGTISGFYDGGIISDGILNQYLEYTLDEEAGDIYSFIIDTSEVDGILVVRDYILDHVFRVLYEGGEKHGGWGSFSAVLNETQRDMIKGLAENQRYNKVYYNGQVVSYLAVPSQGESG